MFKFYFLAVTYGIAFLIIGVYLRKLVVNGDFIRKYLLFFNSHMVSLYFHRCLQANDFVYGDFILSYFN